MSTIKDVARICNISAYTLRYYDKEGLFPFIKRNKAGNRVFTETDIKLIHMICLFKNTGMQIKEMKEYIDLWMNGNEPLELLKKMAAENRKKVLEQINDLKKNLDIIDSKIAFLNSPEAAMKMSLLKN